ncbi:MAG TPA: cytochrome c oxidase subunit II [Candidatus Limnocylindria bacterium]|nr:cytochrome c oxidase subunit II [Candidatus Limnocylindria bacterium]
MRPSPGRSAWLAASRGGPLIAMMALLVGCGMIPPEPETETAESVFTLYNIVFAMGVAVFVGVEAFILYAVVRYRRRDDRLPDQLHGNTVVEIIWTAIPTVIVLILFVAAAVTLGRVEERVDDPGLTIEVTGFQWQWQFHYLDDDGDDRNDHTVVGNPASPPTMVVPVGEPVRVELTSSDVVHSFFVPHFLIKRDMFPPGTEGADNQLEFTITEPGTYSGQCAEFCGDLHARMTFSVEAMERAAFDEWLAAAKAGETPAPSGQAGGPTLEIAADQIAFDTRELTAPADQGFQIHFVNLEGVIHNVSIYGSGNEQIFIGEPITGPDAEITYQIPALPPGEYTFICDYHPVADMTGTLTVE